MKNRKLYLFLSMCIIVLTISLLVTSSSVLLSKVWGIPFGNLLTWAGIVSIPTSIYFAFPGMGKSKRLGRGIRLLILLAVLWFPIACLLSGNLSNTFTGENLFLGVVPASTIFWIFTYGLPIASLAILSLYLLVRSSRKS